MLAHQAADGRMSQQLFLHPIAVAGVEFVKVVALPATQSRWQNLVGKLEDTEFETV